MREADSPLPFWDYCLERRVWIYNLMARDHIKIRGTTPHTVTTGEEGDMSNLCQYKWYDWCYYREHTVKFPQTKKSLGVCCILQEARVMRWPSVLKTNGNVVLRCSLQPLQLSEIHSPSEVRKCETFDHLIKRRWGTLINPLEEPIKTNNDENDGSGYEDDNIKPQLPSLDIEDSVDHNGWLLNQHPAYDRLLNAEVQLQLGEDYITGKVRRRALGPDRNIIRNYDNNPYLNSVMYEVEFIDGQVKEYGANIIAENMLSHVDSNGYRLMLMEGIVDYRKDESVAIGMEDKYITTKTSQ